MLSIVAGGVLAVAETGSAAALTIAIAAASCLAINPPSDKTKFDIFILMGQSNAQGWQTDPIYTSEDNVCSPSILKYSNDYYSYPGAGGIGQWEVAVQPIVMWKRVSLGKRFAEALRQTDSSRVYGLAGATIGATSIRQWVKGGPSYEGGASLYDRAVRFVSFMATFGNVKGILWIQGENDIGNSTWGTSLKSFIADLRQDVGMANLTFLIGEIGRFASNRASINNQIPGVVAATPHSVMVSALDLPCSAADDLHFSSAGQRTYGERFAAAYRQLVGATASQPQSRVVGANTARSATRRFVVAAGKKTLNTKDAFTLRGTVLGRGVQNGGAICVVPR